MNKKGLGYDFHDSVIINCKQEEKDRLILVLQLYETFYPSKDVVQLTFSGIFNSEKASKFITDLGKDNLELDWNGTRVNSIKYDSKKVSQDQDLYVFVDLDGHQPIRIHCEKLRIDKVGDE